MVGYGLPLMVCLLTAVTEFSAPRCAIYRPRFGEKTCFFTGNLAYILYTIDIYEFSLTNNHSTSLNHNVNFIDKVAKGIWFFFPLGILLVINMIIFVLIVHTMYRLEQNQNVSRRKKMKRLVNTILVCNKIKIIMLLLVLYDRFEISLLQVLWVLEAFHWTWTGLEFGNNWRFSE